MNGKKYELLQDQTIEWRGRTLYRIRALRDFGAVHAGDVGGYIECERNLSQDGDAWVCDNAWVSDNALVSDNARVCDNAWVSDNALVSGDSWVSGNACVCDNARVSGNAWVSGNTDG